MRARMLRDSASVLDATYEVGLSGPGRLHDLFVTHEAMSPGEWKARRRRPDASRYGFHPSPFGNALVMATERGLAGLAFADPGEERGGARRHARPLAEGALRRGHGAHRAARPPHLRSRKLWRADQPLRVVLIGTDFEVRVWETLLRIPMGRATTYSDIAAKIGSRQGGARGRRRGRQEPDLVRGAVPPRARQERRPHRLSLGPDAQARHARLGGRARRRRVTRHLLRHFREPRRAGAREIALAISGELFARLCIHEIGEPGVAHATHFRQAADRARERFQRLVVGAALMAAK